jgi:hypothetical protein
MGYRWITIGFLYIRIYSPNTICLTLSKFTTSLGRASDTDPRSSQRQGSCMQRRAELLYWERNLRFIASSGAKLPGSGECSLHPREPGECSLQ